MNDATFRVKPLTFNVGDKESSDLYKRFEKYAVVPFGWYGVEFDKWKNCWVVEYFFDDFNADRFPCNSLEDGIIRANSHWAEIIAGLVESVTPPAAPPNEPPPAQTPPAE